MENASQVDQDNNSQASQGSNNQATPPDLPTWKHDPEGSRGDFARLHPISPLARKEFNKLVEIIVNKPHTLKRAQDYVIYNKLDENDEDYSSDGGEYCGCWRLNLEIPPHYLELGWVVGCSRRGKTTGGVDLLLTPGPLAYNVQGKHFRLQHHRQTGVLMLRADEAAVIINGKEELRNASYAICETTGITVGDMSYKIAFTDYDKARYHKQLRQVMSPNAPNFPKLPYLLTPARNFKLEQDPTDKYILCPVHTGGASSSVSHAYVKATGDSVALKTMKRNSHKVSSIQEEMRILRLLDHKHIYKLIDVINEHRFTPYGHNESDEVILVFSPFCPAISGTIDEMNGLAYLHRNGILHHDVKLDNIGFVDCDPPRAYLMDFGHSKIELESTDHHLGTVRYLAPEVMLLKATEPGSNVGDLEPYGMPADVWSLALCACELYNGRFIKWKNVSKALLQKLRLDMEQNRIGDKFADKLYNLISIALLWEPGARCSAAAARTYLDC